MKDDFIIYGLDDNEKAFTESLEYHEEWMGDCYVTVTVKSPNEIDFHLGDYLMYRGDKYNIDYDPNVIKKAKKGSYGEGFTYENIKLNAVSYGLKRVDFKDVVLNDNGMAYTSLGEFVFFCSSVEDLADRLQANLNRDNGGWKVFTPYWPRDLERGITLPEWNNYYEGGEPKGETDVNISVSSEQRCWDVLNMAYTKFGLMYYINGNHIVIGGKPLIVSGIFRYGKGNGLYEIERTADDGQELITKLFAYGSDKNLPLNYYSNISSKAFTFVTVNDPSSYVATGLSIMLEDNRYDILTKKYYDNESTVRHGSVTVSAGGVKMEGFVELVKKNGNTATVRLLASTTREGLSGADKENAPLTTQEILDAFKQNCGVGAKIYVDAGMNKGKFSKDRVENTTDTGALMVNKLMLPGYPTQSLHDYVAADTDLRTLLDKYTFSTNPKDPWIMSKNNGEIGLHEGTVNFDGNSQKEIYPTIENFSNTIPGGGAPFISDNGIFDGDVPTFKITISNLFDVQEAFGAASEDVHIEMTSGWCVGRSFKITGVKASGNKWVLTCERCYDSSTQRYYPYNYYTSQESRLYQINVGDTFVLTGIPLPTEYVEATARKLLIAACGYLDKRDHMRYVYLPKIDEIFMARNQEQSVAGTSYHDILRAGMKFQFRDTDLGISRYEGDGNTAPFIDVLTIKEDGNDGIPTYDLVMRDEKEKGTLEKIADDINELKGAQSVLERNRTITEHIMEYRLRFYNDNDYPYPDYITSRRTTINIPITPKLWYGEEDITDEVSSWQWDRYVSGVIDPEWGKTHKEKCVTITLEDMPQSWDWQNPTVFECVASINDGTEDLEISAEIGLR